MEKPPIADFGAVFGAAPDRIAVLAPDFTILTVNDAYARSLNLAKVDLVGRNVFHVFADNLHEGGSDGEAKLLASLERVLKSRAADRMPILRYDVRRPPAQGDELEERYLKVLNYPILDPDGRVTHIVHQVEEVTEFVLLQQANMDREAELADAISVCQAVHAQGIFAARLGLDGEVTHANRACLELSGFQSEDVIGKPFWECGWWNRSTAVQAWVKAAFEQARLGETFRGESSYYWADGTERIVKFACMPIKDKTGKDAFIVATGFDITERRQAERDRRATAILESITDAFYAIDRAWRFTYLNHQAQRLLGRTREDLVGKVIWEEYPRLKGTEFEAAYHRTASEQIASSVTSYYPDHDRWYEVHSYPAPDGISVYFRDVSDRIRAQEERERLAAESEKERRIYHAALSNTPDLVFVFDLNHRFMYANEALLKEWGRGWEETIGKTCLELGYEPWQADQHSREIDHVASTRKPIRGEVPFNGTNGHRIYDYFFVPVIGVDGLVHAVAGTARDVTERKEAEEVLRNSEQQFRMTADHAPVLIWISGTDKLCYWFNKPWLDFTGRSMEQELGDGWTENVHPDDLARCLETYTASFDVRKIFTMEYRIKRHDGVYRWVLDNGTPLYGPDGQFTGYISSCVDIHDRMEAEKSLKEADRRKDEFLAMLAHELRNPLAAVSNAVIVLKMSDDENNVSFAKGVIERQTKQLARLIDDLLDVSRITSGKIRLRRELVDLVPILRLAMQSVSPLVEERKHTLVADFSESSLSLRADPTRIEQILVNLLTNAAKYTEGGGRIRLAAERVHEQIVITVQDNGIGIPSEKIPEMFQLFAQGERAMARSEGGLGIGLTIVQKLAEMHGGSVTATSGGPGKGSTFTIRLPAAKTSVEARSETTASARSEPQGVRVLVVDDNVDTAKAIGRLLELLGNHIRLAHNGPSAIEEARSFNPEFILLDIGLPGMDGYEVALRLRQEPCCKASVIIAISGYGQDDDRRRSRESGFDHHLVKPVDLDSLLALMA